MHECMRDDLCIFIRVLASGIYSTITGHEYRHMYIKAHEEPIIQPPGPQYRRKVQIFTLRHLSWPSTPPTYREPDIDGSHSWKHSLKVKKEERPRVWQPEAKAWWR